ncbi:MAG: hypothetical protein HYX78_12335 [Armatimonadetes bacterium]|nr:hypothetical protein [Armatimonadota bacterium]
MKRDRQCGARFRFTAQEFVGSLGDLGTLLPLMVGLIVFNGLDAARVLWLVGLSYILVGVYYGLPMPVQPLKAAAVVAIATGATSGEIRATALWMAGIFLVISLTKLADKLDSIFPRVLVHGLQFGLGLMMVRAGLKLLISFPDGLATVVHGTQSAGGSAATGVLPSAADFSSALFLLVLPQLPLTLGNAVIATTDCARRYFGQAGEHVTAGKLARTIGLGNLAAGLLGGMPMCHGAGGMTAHYQMGARSGASGVMIGTALLVIGMLAGRADAILAAIPAWVLGAPLIYVGVRHAMLAKESFRLPATAAAVLTMGGAGNLQGNLLTALLAGLAVKFLLEDVPLMFNYRFVWFRLTRCEEGR